MRLWHPVRDPWALAQAGQIATDDILAALAGAGYDLGGLRGQIDALAQRAEA